MQNEARPRRQRGCKVMTKTPVIAVLDIGKTNKKVFLFDESYSIVYDDSVQLSESTDEDGFPCEDSGLLRQWIEATMARIERRADIDVKAFNVAAYGASFVNVDVNGRPVTPLYNYLKPYPLDLEDEFYSKYGGRERLSFETASPSLGHLNSGLTLFRLAKQRSKNFTQVNNCLHLPQFASWVFSGRMYSDLTSIGCHTMLWDFSRRRYHDWVAREGIAGKLPVVCAGDTVTEVLRPGGAVQAGVGLHDSSAALIPYLFQFREPFVLLSTGTWSISLNPFATTSLTIEELRKDCLCYLDIKGKPVKASRLFAGHEHEVQVKRIAQHFNIGDEFFKGIGVDYDIVVRRKSTAKMTSQDSTGPIVYESRFASRDISSFSSPTEAYHQLMIDIVDDQVLSTQLVLDPDDAAKNVFVDGGFSHNQLFMALLAEAFPNKKIYTATVHQAPALGAALAIHGHWNRHPIPSCIKVTQIGRRR